MDPNKFGILYDRTFSTIFNYVFKRTGEFEVSKDITAEVFLKAYLTISKFKWRGIPLKSWLYKLATNETNLYFRRKKYAMNLKDTLGKEAFHQSRRDALIMEQAEAERKLHEHKEFQKVQKALQELDIYYQEVLSLRYFEGRKIKEISNILGRAEGTIKSQLSRGLEKLKKSMNVQPNREE